MQWHGTWRALIHRFWPEKTQLVVSLCHPSTMRQSLLVPLVLVVARTRRTAWSKATPNTFGLFIFKLSHRAISNKRCWCCYRKDSKILSMVGIHTPKKNNAPLLQCTHHMCPIRVHWHVKVNYKDYWRVKMSITNFNYRLNHTLWSLVVQHPNLNNVTQVFSFDYKPLVPYESISKCLRNCLSSPLFRTCRKKIMVWQSCGIIYMQMIRVCSMAWSSTTTY